MKKRSPVSRKKALPNPRPSPRKPLLNHSRSKKPGSEIPSPPLFRLPDVEACRAQLREMAEEFLEYGTIPSSLTFEEIEERINESGILPDEDEALWEALAGLTRVLKEVKDGK